MLKGACKSLFLSRKTVLWISLGTATIISSASTLPPDQLIRQITKDPANDYHVKWSPDGTRIAFMSKRSGKRDIWIVSVTGGEPVRFTEGSECGWPSWSPDGKTIAFSSTRAGNTDIWVKDVKENFPFLKGPYLGQKLPGISPESFAANIPELHFLHGMIRFSPDGQEAYWRTANAQQISVSKIEKGQWTRPKAASFSVEGQADDSPVFSPNGKRLFFISSRAVTDGEQTRKERIWVIERIPEGWSEPRPLPDIINSTKGIGWQFSVDSHSNLYFGVRSRVGIGDIYCAKYVNGQYNQPEKMRPEINAAGAYNHSPYIYPDGRTLLFSRDYQRGPAHIHVSFLRKDGTWTEAQILNKDWKLSGLPAVTADGKYLFFIGDCGSSLTCWVDASFIEDLRKKAPIDSN